MSKPREWDTTDQFKMIAVEHDGLPGSKSGKILTLKPTGFINEKVDFTETYQEIEESSAKQVEFDLADTTQINSQGLHRWLGFLGRLQGIAKISFLRINEIFIDQANVLPNVFGKPGTPLIAFEVPYFCVKCNRRSSSWLRMSDVKLTGGRFTTPPASCTNCGSPMQFDAIESEYYRFLTYQTRS